VMQLGAKISFSLVTRLRMDNQRLPHSRIGSPTRIPPAPTNPSLSDRILE
jgi:hypothetical protein